MTGVRSSDPNNQDIRGWDAVLKENPPVIRWRKNTRGVLVHTFVDDPHADLGWRSSPGTVEKDARTRREAQARTPGERKVAS